MAATDTSLDKATILALCSILLMVFLLFSNGITPSFSADDYIHLEKNIGFENIWQAGDVFLHMDGREYRPLVRLSLWLNHKMGTTARPFHVTNLLLHMACIACLFFLFRKLVDNRICALTACLLFALHPIHTTNVHFIMGRTGILCALFYFLALLTFPGNADYRKKGLYVLSLTFFILALLTKEEAVSLPIVLFFTLLLHPIQRFRRPAISAAVHLIPFFVVLGIYFALRLFFLQDRFDDIAVYTDFNGLHILVNYAKWVVGLVYPFDLYQARWAVETGQFSSIAMGLIMVGIFTAGLVYVAWPSRRKLLADKMVWLCFLWFLITLMPIMGGNAHRWYLYIPSVCLPLLVMAVWRHRPKDLRNIMFATLLVLVNLTFAVEVYKQSAIWSRQSAISQSFLKQAKDLGIHKLEAFNFINMPFGYKSAFLFTFNSFQSALAIDTGRKPQMKIMSYANLGDSTKIKAEKSGNRLTFTMEPSAVTYFIFPGLQRTFPSADVTITIDTCRIRLRQLSPGNTAAAYEFISPPNPETPTFYYDGSNIHPVSFGNH